jgi:23S rRNA (adenine2503-C2)-methyltransferase
LNEQRTPSADILSLSYPALQAQLAIWGEPAFRARQLWQWLYVRLAADFDEMTNLPQALRNRLAQFYRLSPLTPIDELVSEDGLTRKVLFRLPDGETIESVWMEYDRGRTVCVSSQVGCALGCAFCATGQGGFVRDLSPAEIVDQVLYFARGAAPRGDATSRRAAQQSVSNVVLMGMGEPLLNYDAVWQAIETWNDHQGFDLGARRITLSTAGIVPGIRRLAQESLQVGLAVSLHAADDALRDRLVPVNRRYPLADLLVACRDYVAQTGRRITIEVALIDGVNDDVEQAGQLARLLRGLECHVNLIPLNPSPGADYRPSPRHKVAAFQRALADRQIAVTVRLRRGIDIQAGCGQLRQRENA